MRSKPLIAVSAFVVVIAALAVATIFYDHGRRDTIAKGVSVGGVDIGGLKADAARAKLQRVIHDPLNQTVTIDHGKKKWHLTAKEARVATNLDATVADALARSRQGNIVNRSWRNLTGGRVSAQLQPEVTYSDQAISRLLSRVRQGVDRPAVDASVTFTAAGMKTTDSRDGLTVDTALLRQKIRAALGSPTADRRFGAKTSHVVPKLTSTRLAAQYGTTLIVNRAAFTLTLYKKLHKVQSWSVAIGAVGLDTPAGLYHIQNKAVDPAWTKPFSSWVPKDQQGKVVPGGTAANPLKARWLGIFDGAGIHGVDPSEYGSIGHAASHGCVRMRIPDVEALYPQVPVGSPIYIA